MVGGGTTRNM